MLDKLAERSRQSDKSISRCVGVQSYVLDVIEEPKVGARCLIHEYRNDNFTGMMSHADLLLNVHRLQAALGNRTTIAFDISIALVTLSRNRSTGLMSCSAR